MQMRHWVDTMAAKLDVPLQPPTQQPDAWCMSRFVPARFPPWVSRLQLPHARARLSSKILTLIFQSFALV